MSERDAQNESGPAAQDRRDEIYLGCITGTSVDALDIAAIRVQPAQTSRTPIQVVAAQSVPLPRELRDQLLRLGQPDQASSLDELGIADAQLGTFIGESIVQFISAHDLDTQSITALGSHGQTVRHRPGQFTLQIGDPNRIAEISQVDCVADFRRRDMAAGGQGAPLVPPFHQALFAGHANTYVLNIGGISNVTVLGAELRGFDTGPGNCLMDSWFTINHNLSGEGRAHEPTFDLNGDWAKGGQVDEALLTTLMSDTYFAEPPPKSTGREHFNLDWLQHRLANQSAQDIQATLCEFTALSVVRAIEEFTSGCDQLVVCGGGRLNQHLMARLQEHSGQTQVLPCEALGIDGDSVEAAAFAWLAYQTVHGLSGNAPEVTGALGPRVLGTIYPA